MYLTEAIKLIQQEVGLLICQSKIYETAAWGKTDQAPFLNQVIVIASRFDAEATLLKVLAIEKTLGRERKEKWGPRSIDIDLLLMGDKCLSSDRLDLPHPFLHQRSFVLTPLKELAPHAIHPIHQKTIEELGENCTDKTEVKIWGNL